MRETLRPLPPAYVRGDHPFNAESSTTHLEESLSLRSGEEEDLPPYSRTDPLATAPKPTVEAENASSATQWQSDLNTDDPGRWLPRRRSEERENEDDLEASNVQGEAVLITTGRVPGDIGFARSVYGSNPESIQPSKRRRKGCGRCCQCSLICWLFWLFWVVVIAVSAGVAAAQVF